MMLALCATALVAVLTGWDIGGNYLWLLAIAMGLVAVGVVDDIQGLPVRVRLAIYLLACLLALPLALGAPGTWPPAIWWASPLLLVGLLWLVNLYNFMDGIDGLAATQCILAAGTAALLVLLGGGDAGYALACLSLAGVHAGFLAWNWPPARLFMGDAGSVSTGFLLGALALLGAGQGALPLACWLILLAGFITDASVTLLWRACTGQDIASPHRLHAYQRLSRVFGGHRPVVFLLLGLHLIWLAPLATLAASFPEISSYLVILAYIPLLPGMAKALRLG